jgi:hypothetical protein
MHAELFATLSATAGMARERLATASERLEWLASAF